MTGVIGRVKRRPRLEAAITPLTRILRVSLFRQAGIYTVSNLIGRAIPFLLLPILTRYLSPTDYGLVTMFMLTAAIVEPFIGIALPAAITVKYFDVDTDLPSYLATGFVTIIVLALPIGLLLLLAGQVLSDLTEVPVAWLLLVVPLAITRVIGTTLLTLLRVAGRATLYALLQNFQSLALIFLTLLLVVAIGLDWRGRVASELTIWTLFTTAGLAIVWRTGALRGAFSASYARGLVGFGLPLVPHVLGGILIMQTDRILLTNMVGIDQTGLYSVGYQLAFVIELVAVSFNYAYAPWLFRKLTDASDGVRRRLVVYTYAQFAAMAALAAAVSIVMPWLAGQLLDPSFAASGQYVGWLSIGFFFSGTYYMVTNYILFAQRTGLLAAVTITTAVINIPLTYLLIEANGAIGAAQASAASLALAFVGTWIVSQRVYPMPWLSSLRRGLSL